MKPAPATGVAAGTDPWGDTLHRLLSRAPRRCTLVMRAAPQDWAATLQAMQQVARLHPGARKVIACPGACPSGLLPDGVEVLADAPQDDESLLGLLMSKGDTGDAVIRLAATDDTSAGRRHDAAVWRWLFAAAWRLRGIAAWVLPAGLRGRVRERLARRAWSDPFTAPVRPAGRQGLAAPEAVRACAGVAMIGALSSLSGVGEAARATRRALEAAGVDCQAFDSDRPATAAIVGDRQGARGRGPRPRPLVSLLHLNADRLAQARVQWGEALFDAPHRIGCWAWELEQFPAGQHVGFAHVDEVWVPSRFCQQAVAAAARVPVLCMPHALAPPGPPRPDRARFGLAAEATVFLAMADGMSSLARKNPLGALQAFAAAFQHWPDPVQLLVKLSHGQRDPALRHAVLELAARTPGVLVLEELLTRESVGCLLDSVDAFVSLHRSEGFGLVIAESMARGKVALATGWSGNMDFMTRANSIPLAWRMTTLPSDQGPYRRGQRWAEPDPDDAVNALRLVASDHGLRDRLGSQAREDMARQLAPAQVGRRMATRLAEITQALGGDR
jgi:glycosyltransferase involved in cell wall biosynthesis